MDRIIYPERTCSCGKPADPDNRDGLCQRCAAFAAWLQNVHDVLVRAEKADKQ